MTQSKQEIINKILSFSYEELTTWIKSRLQGDDKYFPIYEGYESNLSDFLSEAFEHIKNKTFRENFLEILDDLTTELWGITKDKKKVDANKDYIYELLSLCGSIKKFQKKSTLYRIARSGKLKGIKAHDLELHQLLLTALASYQVSGDYHFWLQQMEDGSNKYYTNAAFYALINRKYDLDIVFKQIGTFIDRFKGEISLVWGIRALINKYGERKISEKFQSFASKLSAEQKEAVNAALKKSRHMAVYNIDDPTAKEYKYTPTTPQLQYVRAPTPGYDTLSTLKESSAEIFKLMGFEVELNRKIVDRIIDLFAKRKKSFTSSYECWICMCDTANRKVSKKSVDDFSAVWEQIKKELQKQTNDDCQAMIISGKGFTKTAIEAAKIQNIVLKTYNRLLSDLNTFYSHQKPLIQDLDALISH
jgi:hypothetical protein